MFSCFVWFSNCSFFWLFITPGGVLRCSSLRLYCVVLLFSFVVFIILCVCCYIFSIFCRWLVGSKVIIKILFSFFLNLFISSRLFLLPFLIYNFLKKLHCFLNFVSVKYIVESMVCFLQAVLSVTEQMNYCIGRY